MIASDAGEQCELPEDCVVKVPLGGDEVRVLGEAIVALRDDRARLDALERGARRFVEEECHWGLVAQRYVEHMERFPRPRTTKRARIQLRLATERG